MMAGHMDGLGRFLTILQLESEVAVNTVQPAVGANNTLELNRFDEQSAKPFRCAAFFFVPASVLTYNELLVNPTTNLRIREALGHNPIANVSIDTQSALPGAEF